MVRTWAAGLAVVLLTGCGVAGPAPLPSSRTTPAAAQPGTTRVDVGRATSALAGLRRAPRPRNDGTYRRDSFGGSWRDTDGNGCNQRDDVLLRDAVPGSTTLARQGRCDHDVLAGTWIDPYTGHTIVLTDAKDLAQSQRVQIDHVVPLAEAWGSGASAWPAARRMAYANDLRNLLAVDGPTNAGKGSDDPAAWRPKKDFQCEYAARWTLTKKRWRLAVDQPEVDALTEMLGYCG